MANIAEGFGRGTRGEFVASLGYSIGSLDKTQAHLSAAYDREYLSKDEFGELFQEGTEIREMIVAFVQSIVRPSSEVRHSRKQIDWTEEVWERYERITGRDRPEMSRTADGRPSPPYYMPPTKRAYVSEFF
jgi:hypothetical protein